MSFILLLLLPPLSSSHIHRRLCHFAPISTVVVSHQDAIVDGVFYCAVNNHAKIKTRKSLTRIVNKINNILFIMCVLT
jgi:hypothetical protein